MQADINKLKGELRNVRREFGDFRRAKDHESELATQKFCTWRLRFEDELVLSRTHTCVAVKSLLKSLSLRSEEETQMFLAGSCSQFECDELLPGGE